MGKIYYVAKFKMEHRLNFEGMISHLIFKAKQMARNSMPTVNKNCKDNGFTGLIRHLVGIVL